MLSPYKGKFRVSSPYGYRTMSWGREFHDGIDLVGVDSKKVYSTINGKVVKAGWENPLNKKQGYGQYVRIVKSGTKDHYYFAHLSKINVKKGQTVKVGDLLGVEGSTGLSTGLHCHYGVRTNASKSKHKNISELSGIPNKVGTYTSAPAKTEEPKKEKPKVSYFKKYVGNSVSIVVALKSIGVTSTFVYRSKIAKANGIKGYIGTAKQNTTMLNLLKKGKLIKP